MQPMIWLFTASGFSAWPQSCAAQILSSFTTPVSGSTCSSVTYAPNEYVGESPAPAPLYAPPSFGDWYQPLPMSAPDSGERLLERLEVRDRVRRVVLVLDDAAAHHPVVGLAARDAAAARRSWSRTCSAALIAALPTMNVIRDE